jgi:hypothetical protein
MPQSIRPPLVQVVIFVVLLPFVHQLFLNPGILPSTHETKDVNFLNKLFGNRLQLKPATPNSCAGYIASYPIIITLTIPIIIINQVCMCRARSSGQRILMTLDKACPVLTLLGCCKRHT